MNEYHSVSLQSCCDCAEEACLSVDWSSNNDCANIAAGFADGLFYCVMLLNADFNSTAEFCEVEMICLRWMV